MQRNNNNNNNNSNNGGTGAHAAACASCKHQRKKCGEECPLAPYFPAERAREFQAVHKVFGVSNVMKLVRSVSKDYKKAVVESLIWEATCRQKDPILGPYGEYRKIEEQLRLYKSQSQILCQNLNPNQSVHLSGQVALIQKPGPVVIPWTGSYVTNGINNNKGIINAGGGVPSNMSMISDFPYGNPNSNRTHDSEKLKQEKDAQPFLVSQPQQQQQKPHFINGFNEEQYYPSGAYGLANGWSDEWQDEG